jgi:hypothetical protein
VPCNHCRAIRQHGTVLHGPGCPADAGSVAFFSHPDLIELDLHGAAFYPEQ